MNGPASPPPTPRYQDSLYDESLDQFQSFAATHVAVEESLFDDLAADKATQLVEFLSALFKGASVLSEDAGVLRYQQEELSDALDNWFIARELSLSEEPLTEQERTAWSYVYQALFDEPEKSVSAFSAELDTLYDDARLFRGLKKIKSLLKNTPRKKMTTQPARGAKGAPSFNEKEPEELPRYLEDVDELIKTHSITDDEEKKALLVRYTKLAVERQWKALPAWEKGKTYEDFKTAVLAEYPEVDSLTAGTRRRLEDVLHKYKGLVEYDLSDLMAYKREFNAEASSLGDLLSNSVLVELFLSSLHPEFSNRVIAALSLNRQAINTVVDSFKIANAGGTLNFPAASKRRADDRYELKEVINMAVDLSRQAIPLGGSFRTARTPMSSTLDTIVPKTESLQVLERLDQQENLLAQLKDSLLLSSKQQTDLLETVKKMREGDSAQFQQSQEPVKTAATTTAAVQGGSYQDNRGDRNNYNDYNRNRGYDSRRAGSSRDDNRYAGSYRKNNPRSDDDCRYCGELGHYVSDCLVRREDEIAGLIKRTPAGRVCLPNMEPIGYNPSQAMRKTVLDYHEMEVKSGPKSQLYHDPNYDSEEDDSLKAHRNYRNMEFQLQFGKDEGPSAAASTKTKAEKEIDWQALCAALVQGQNVQTRGKKQKAQDFE